MRLAFLHARQDPKYAHAMLAAARRVMPWVRMQQLTDLETPGIDGCEVVRLDWSHPNPMIFKMEHLARMDGDVLVIDTDVILQADVSSVFNLDFDVALTWRDGPIYDPNGTDITKAMPINCGVMFCREPRFWHACLQWCVGKNPGWYADQLAVAQTVSRFNVLRLHADNFNYTPRSAQEDVSGRFAVHYKGKSRKLLDERLAA